MPAPPFAAGSGLERVLRAHRREIAPGVAVARMLPAIERRTVGPFVFLDQMGPLTFARGAESDVLPHPHIGLATVTYLFAGEIVHRDSLGSVQTIRPGDVNWMTAGRGIVHSERPPPHLREREARLFGLQFWVGLPLAAEESEPAFAHRAAAALPTMAAGGARLRLVAGALAGLRSPVATASPTLLADLDLDAGARLTIPAEHRERALQVASGAVEIGGVRIEAPGLAVLEEGRTVAVSAPVAARCALFGGDPLDGERRHMWWNFVASSKERIERAKADWSSQRFPPIPGETEFIPLPA